MIGLALVIGLAILGLLVARFERDERPLLVGGFLAHQAAVGALLWFYAVKSGDMDGYELSARNIARLLRADFNYWAPELARLIAHQDSRLFVIGMSQVPTTAAAHGWGGVAQFLSGGDSLAGACLVVSAFGFLSKALLYAVARESVDRSRRWLAAAATMFVPSALFWTSGLIKEAFAMIGLGLLVYGLHRTFAKGRYLMLPLVLMGAAMIASVKPYVLFPVILAFGAWVFAARNKSRVGAVYVVAAVGVALAGVVALGELFPQFGIEKVSDAMAAQRRASEMSGGGSFVGGETEEGDIERSGAGQLLFLPLALLNSLVRPFIFEARSVPQLGAALENTVLLLLVLRLLRRYRLRDVQRAIMQTPSILASVVFALTFASAVGLSSKNLGTLSRYRVPLMPAYVAAVVILGDRLRETSSGSRSTAAPAMRRAIPRIRRQAAARIPRS